MLHLPEIRTKLCTIRGPDTPILLQAEEILFQEQIAKILPLAEATKLYTPLFLAFFRQFEALNAKLILAKIFGLQTLEQWYDIGPYSILQRCLLSETTTLTRYPCGVELAPISQMCSKMYQITGRWKIRVDICAARNLYEASAPLNPEAKLDFRLFDREKDRYYLDDPVPATEENLSLG